MRAIVHAKVVLPDRVLENGTVLINGQKIQAVGTDIELPAGTEVVDAAGCYVGPGFVDIHIHGSGIEKKRWPDDPESVAQYHLRHGTTAINACLGYSTPKQELIAQTKMIQSLIDSGKLPSVYGVGFEGPYINPHEGANTEKNDRCGPDEDEYTQLYEACRGHVLQWMYAPEMDRDGRFGDFLRDHNVVTAVGHTEASPAQIRAAVDKGATIATHLFDAMGCWRGTDSINETGIIQDTAADGCLICPELTYEIIPDSRGVHVKPANMKLTYMLAGPHRVAIITDCTTINYDPADYPPEDKHSAPDLNYNENGELSGSVLTMDRAFRNFMKHTGSSVIDTFLMAATTPAKAVRIDRVTGSVVPGKYADLVIMDSEFNLKQTIFHGEPVK